MADDHDLDAIAKQYTEGTVNLGGRDASVVALVAEVRRLRVVEDAARNAQEFRDDCDDPRAKGLIETSTCRERFPASPEDWCATCALVHALEPDRG